MESERSKSPAVFASHHDLFRSTRKRQASKDNQAKRWTEAARALIKAVAVAKLVAGNKQLSTGKYHQAILIRELSLHAA
jgi:hypothetical protein